MSQNRMVLTVGNCSYDHGNLSKLLKDKFNVIANRASDREEALNILKENKHISLILVNRVFDEDGDSGLDFIQELRSQQETHTIPVMLISNFPEAQEEAVKRGALKGFGKADLGAKPMIEKLTRILASEQVTCGM